MSRADITKELILPSDRLIVAYDGMEWEEEGGITQTAQEVGPHTGLGKTNSAHVKIGTEAIARLNTLGQLTMFDSKFHDIPRTVELSVKAATEEGASLITIHASGGLKMLKAAVAGREEGRKNVVDGFKKEKSGLLLGITVLTSLKDETFSIFGLDETDKDAIRTKVIEFAHLAVEAGLDGVVCSPEEADALRSISKFDELAIVTPGITPEFAVQESDQARSTTAREAMNRGADMIVVGSGINKAPVEYGMTKAEAAIAIGDEIKLGIAA